MSKREPEILKKTLWMKERGAFPSRIVLLKHFTPDGKVKEYSTHLQTNQGDCQPFFYGHYYQSLRAARADFEIRARAERGLPLKK